MKTVGIIGGGQLGRMLAMAAARLNFRTIILEPQIDCPAAQVANGQIVAAYDDPAALKQLAAECNVVTYEFENVPVGAAEMLAQTLPVYPPPKALAVSQDRVSEKQFLNGCGIETARFHAIDSQEQLEQALADFSGQGVLKTRRLGYDGKGQRVFKGASDDATGAYAALGDVPMILESFVAFQREISIIAARGTDGTIACYDPAENIHRNGILHTSTVPASINETTAEAARLAAAAILTALGYVGVIGVEFFVLADGSLIVNEIAPRVHNSGHWTEAACVVSQFEQHIRAVTGLALSDGARHSDCVMQNLIGDDINDLPAWLAKPNTLVHLYGKTEARPGRKMGHVTWLA
ncbi:5-(carboxyamino)imidazole ribonucleotide synthase [Rhizobium sp. LjRoot98]|uniref:5-(carboxyamino)imidazole ribonucleotide synthase n=1 Tax=unclassified Rhizobium TaxID=2613769 RepID=UPI00071446DE|nr:MULTISPECIES: 5-(carboxyamino)imidazole ribonucleotide synthase [unclassified Rhizobium]KQV29179.1 phosphoribosylaminoimidazole carboxylase [Rhizobium sp. Root1204]KQY03675.1 phosphoribosylaminoimidazole carboxylase [Rhizobium sp. Root1334]KRC00319.1 phosphoribosylaminoimidazole carboxylase [Rhizobium sp. Root73]